MPLETRENLDRQQLAEQETLYKKTLAKLKTKLLNAKSKIFHILAVKLNIKK